jgi:hypothetical protein
VIADPAGRARDSTGCGRVNEELPGQEEVAVLEHEVPVLAIGQLVM